MPYGMGCKTTKWATCQAHFCADRLPTWVVKIIIAHIKNKVKEKIIVFVKVKLHLCYRFGFAYDTSLIFGFALAWVLDAVF